MLGNVHGHVREGAFSAATCVQFSSGGRLEGGRGAVVSPAGLACLPAQGQGLA